MSSLLAKRGRIGSVEIKNRMVMAAMGDLIANPDGSVSDATIAYYGARAKGGIGLIITGIVRINNEDGTAGPNQMSLADDSYIPGFKRLVDEVHAHGCKIFPQIQHSGRQGVAMFTGSDHVLAPSAIPSAITRQPTKALTIEQILQLVGQFGDAARRAMEAGADGVEIHGAHGYLINQFLSPFSNKRDDAYGGSFENRMRFLGEIIQDVKDKTKGQIAISVRLSVDEFLSAVGVTEAYIDLAEGIRIAQAVEAEGVDAINVSCGTYESMNLAIEPVSVPQGWRKDFVKAVKDAVSLPVIAVAKLREPAVAEAFLEEGVMDFASFGRALLADPEFPNKAIAGKGETVRRCISCLYCFEELNKGSHVVCAVNPRTGFETKYQTREQTSEAKTAVVVGAGPAGLNAAVTLTKNGHNVTLLEASNAVGGQVRIGKNPPKKDQLAWMIEDYEREIQDLGIDLRLNHRADPASVKAMNADIVYLACGAKAIRPAIPGVDAKNVYSVEDILDGGVDLANKTVAVIGSGLTGLEIAELLQESGNKTLIVEMQDSIAPNAYMQNLADVQSRLQADLTEYLSSRQLVAIKTDSIELKDSKSTELFTRPVDAVVLSIGYKPDKTFLDGFKHTAPNVVVIGDADEVRNIGAASKSAFSATYTI